MTDPQPQAAEGHPMTDILVGTSHDSSVRYVAEPQTEGEQLRATVVPLLARDWNVTDPEARRTNTTARLGFITEQNRHDAMWMIDPDRNAAALLVFRPDSFKRAVGEDPLD